MTTVRRLVIGLSAIGVGLIVWSLSPASWDSGSGRLEIAVRGDVVIDAPVTLGREAAVDMAARTDAVAVAAELPGGVPLDSPIEVEFTVDDPTVSLSDVSLTLVLDNGDRESIPVLDQSGEQFRAVRRPPAGIGVVLGLLAAVLILWVSEVVPIFVTALTVPVVVTVAGTSSASEALAPFFDPIIVLFFAGFLMAEAMRRVGIDQRIAAEVVARTGRSPATLFVAMLAIAAFMSMWMSNTAAVAVLLPVAMTITEPLRHPGYRKAVVLGLAYAATIGGVGSAIGTPANLLAIDFLDRVAGDEITFAGWFGYGLPMVVLFLPVLAIYMRRISRIDVDPAEFAAVRERASAQAASAPEFTLRQVTVVVVLGLVVTGWLTQQWHGQPPGIVALAGAIVLFTLGLNEPEDLARISWPTLLTFGGGLALGSFMVTTGAADWMVARLGVLGSWPTFAAVAAVAVVALVLTTVASNTGSAAMLIPLAIPLAGLIGVAPTMLVIIVAIASSVDFALVIGTPPTLLAYSSDLFTVREILRKGSLLDVLGIAVLLIAVVPLWQLLGLV